MTNYPTIGIRPIIDGRRFGVRESLEEKTMQMAKMAKELIESEIRYPDGTPMKCVISDCTIGGGEEAARCAQQFATQNVCATLSVTPCWCYGSETMDLDPSTIKAGFVPVYYRRFGALTAPSVPARYIWPPLWPLTTKEACLPSLSTVTTSRMSRIPPFPATLRKKFSGSPAAPALSA